MAGDTKPASADWKTRLSELLPLFGHRNWIVVADSAYPAQSKPGIETIVSGAEQLHVVRHVLEAIAASAHIRANIYADKELAYVPDADAPGVADYRRELDAALHGAHVKYISHEEIIAKLDQSAQVFRILLIKTDMTIPYTSVFFELDCGYWDAEAEQRLRETIAAADSK
jgi:D-ribose pyranose/furanose isomerase RbsD